MSTSNHAGGRWSRRQLLGAGAAGALVAGAGISIPFAGALSGHPGTAKASSDENARLGEVYRLQAAFHRAKTTQDIDLMMSLWKEGASLTVQGDTNSPYTGADRLRAYWLGSGSFTHSRFSLVPSYKIRIKMAGDQADLYFECHDIGDYTLPTRAIAGDTFLAGTIVWSGKTWLFKTMTAGKATPLSVDHYYFP